MATLANAMRPWRWLALAVACCGCQAIDDFGFFRVVGGWDGAPGDLTEVGDLARTVDEGATAADGAAPDANSGTPDLAAADLAVRPCDGGGACMPGEQRTMPCGQCGVLTQTCGMDCQWVNGICNGQGVCAPGQQRTTACGKCGMQTDNCGMSCQWSAGTCQGEGPCTPGDKQSCPNCKVGLNSCNGYRRCGANCKWESQCWCNGTTKCD